MIFSPSVMHLGRMPKFFCRNTCCGSSRDKISSLGRMHRFLYVTPVRIRYSMLHMNSLPAVPTVVSYACPAHTHAHRACMHARTRVRTSRDVGELPARPIPAMLVDDGDYALYAYGYDGIDVFTGVGHGPPVSEASERVREGCLHAYHVDFGIRRERAVHLAQDPAKYHPHLCVRPDALLHHAPLRRVRVEELVHDAGDRAVQLVDLDSVDNRGVSGAAGTLPARRSAVG